MVLKKDQCLLCGNKGVRLYKIPKSLERLKLWLKLIGREDLLSHENYHIYVSNNGRLCGAHFADWCFCSTQKERLIRYAKPCTESAGATSEEILAEIQSTMPLSDVSSSAGVPYAYYHHYRNQAPFRKVPEKRPLTHRERIETLHRDQMLEHIKKQERLINRLRKKGYKMKRDFAKFEKRKEEFLNHLKDNLSPMQYCFLLSQVRNSALSLRARRWTNEEKEFASSIYSWSPGAYRLLKKKILMPSRMTLKRPMKSGDAEIEPAEQMAQESRAEEAVTVSDLDRFCMLAFAPRPDEEVEEEMEEIVFRTDEQEHVLIVPQTNEYETQENGNILIVPQTSEYEPQENGNVETIEVIVNPCESII